MFDDVVRIQTSRYFWHINFVSVWYRRHASGSSWANQIRAFFIIYSMSSTRTSSIQVHYYWSVMAQPREEVN